MCRPQTMRRKKPKQENTAALRQLAADWEKLKSGHAKPLEKGARSKGVELPPVTHKTHKTEKLTQAPHTASPRESTLYKAKSRNTGEVTAAKRDSQKYTGDKMLGVAQMSKSNAVPVFGREEAVDISKMRR